MSYYIIIREPMACGKSTISKELAKQLNAEYISLDKVMDEHDLDKMPPDVKIPPENFIKTNELILQKVRDYLESGKPIILDACFYYKEAIQHIENNIEYPGFVFTLKVPVAECIKRDKNRENSYGKGSVIYIHSIVSEFDYGHNIDVTQSVEESVNQIIGFIDEKK